MARSICTGFTPPSEWTSTSFTFKTYCGKSAKHDNISKPKGGLRLRSCRNLITIQQKKRPATAYCFNSKGVLLSKNI